MNTESFYVNLPILDNFLEITDSHKFHSLPSDWYVVITDIVSSTKAIEDGRYKQVNFLGASSIAAVLNIAGEIEIPFVFGGDGATLLIPPSLYAKAIPALLATRQLAKTEFGMNLRVGVVPVSVVAKANYDVKVAKVRVSENYYQAAFTGNGLNYATELIKNPASDNPYHCTHTDSHVKADFSGLECRWQDIPSQFGETLSLLVKATSTSSENNDLIYQELLEKIQEIYGSEEDLNPVTPENLNLSFNYKALMAETRLRAKSSDSVDQLLYLSKVLLENLWMWFLITFKIELDKFNWGRFKEVIIAATDYEKFDDVLHMVIASNQQQRKQLTEYLEATYKKGKLVYGLHISDRALMTCLVFEHKGKQVHFVDGADGGYAMAAKAMKQRNKTVVKSHD